MSKPRAYEGSEPYIFISYAHKDSDTVLPIISALQEEGFRVWYDAGIEVGTEWPEYIAERLNSCASFVTFMSDSAADSHNCRREVNFAIKLRKEPLVVYLEDDVHMTLGMQMQLDSLQAIFFRRHSTMISFVHELSCSQLLAPCREATDHASESHMKDDPVWIARNFQIENGILIKYRGVDHDVVIPNCVMAIGENAFSKFDYLTSIHIPSSVTEIESNAFEGCISLTSIHISDSVKSIGAGAFKGCANLTSIHIPDSVKSIGAGAFKGCASLTSIHIPDSITVINLSTFKDCTSLTSIRIPESVTLIDGFAFSSCSNLTSIDIPNSVMMIGGHAFSCCTSLTSVYIPDSVIVIGYGAFKGTTSLEEISIPRSLNTKYIGAPKHLIRKR